MEGVFYGEIRWANVRAMALIVCPQPQAAEIGLDVMRRGGNAVDAAVTCAFVQSVIDPQMCGLGGCGAMLVHSPHAGDTLLEFYGTAGSLVREDQWAKIFIREAADRYGYVLEGWVNDVGYQSVAVPGTVAGLELALKTFGTMKLTDVMAPAIRLAENGYPVSAKLAKELKDERKDLQQFSVSRRIFLKNGEMYVRGETLRQPELAATLKRIAKNGSTEFYRGETAHMLVRDMLALGGLITLEDLAQYQPKVREVLRAKYAFDGHHWEVLSAPPPSSGGVAMVEALNVLKDVSLKGWDDTGSVHIVAETMRRVFADRAAYLADPDFAKIPVDGLTSACYAKEIAATIDPRRASPSTTVHAGEPHVCGEEARNSAPVEINLNDGPHTTHFSVVDVTGNAVASTTTLNNGYGSHVTSSAGFLLNDEMDDFTTQPGVPNALFGLIQSEANAIAPGHRPLSSMTPTILLRDNKLSFVTGSPGGPTIISAVLLTVINWMRLGMDAQAAINAPRFHHQWLPDRLLMERQFPASLEQGLNAMGHATKRRGHIGLVNAIGIDSQTGERLGAADPRDEGSAVGY
jgi:gamma-glutamyltranspeptidase / glutathione hydrolase